MKTIYQNKKRTTNNFLYMTNTSPKLMSDPMYLEIPHYLTYPTQN